LTLLRAFAGQGWASALSHKFCTKMAAGGWSSWTILGRGCHPSGCRSCFFGPWDRAFLWLRLWRTPNQSPCLLKPRLLPELRVHSHVWCRDCLPLPAVVLRRSREAYDVVGFTLLPEPRTHEFRGQQKAKCDGRGGEGDAPQIVVVVRPGVFFLFGCPYLSNLKLNSRPSSSRWTWMLTSTGGATLLAGSLGRLRSKRQGSVPRGDGDGRGNARQTYAICLICVGPVASRSTQGSKGWIVFNREWVVVLGKGETGRRREGAENHESSDGRGHKDSAHTSRGRSSLCDVVKVFSRAARLPPLLHCETMGGGGKAEEAVGAYGKG